MLKLNKQPTFLIKEDLIYTLIIIDNSVMPFVELQNRNLYLAYFYCGLWLFLVVFELIMVHRCWVWGCSSKRVSADGIYFFYKVYYHYYIQYDFAAFSLFYCRSWLSDLFSSYAPYSHRWYNGKVLHILS